MRYTSFSPVFQTIFPSFFTLFRAVLSENASTFPFRRKCPKRKHVFPQTPKHFYTNTPAFFCTNIHIHAPEGKKPRKNVAFQQNKYYFCNAITKNKSLPSRPCAWER